MSKERLKNKKPLNLENLAVFREPPVGIEPMTYRLQV
jgi:hypothetical protein